MKYIVVANDYEYNDETYDQRDGYTISSKLFNTKEEAQGEADKLLAKNYFTPYGKKKFDSSIFNLAEYASQYDDDIKQYFEEKGYPFEENGWEFYLPQGLTEKEVSKALKGCGIEFYKVIGIDE